VFVAAQVLRKLANPFAQKRNLHFRGTRIAFMALVPIDNFNFQFFVERHDVCYLLFRFCEQVSRLSAAPKAGPVIMNIIPETIFSE
jgi:hypothetical protein